MCKVDDSHSTACTSKRSARRRNTGKRRILYLVYGEWMASDELAEKSLYNTLKSVGSGMPVATAPLGPWMMERFPRVCSACGKPRN